MNSTIPKKTATFDPAIDSGENNSNVLRYTALNRTDFDMSVIDNWCEIRCSNAPKRRSNHISFIYDESLYIFGGMDINEGKMNDLYSLPLTSGFDNPKWKIVETVGIIPEALCYHSGVVYDVNLYVFGGENRKGEATNDLYILNIKEKKWEKRLFSEKEIPNLMGHTANFSNKIISIIIFGGFSHGKYLNNIHYFDIAKNEWSFENYDGKANLPRGRIGHTSTLVNDKFLYVFGGQTNDGLYLNDLWKFNLEDHTWEEIIVKSEIPKARSGHSAVYNDSTNCIYYFGGKTGNIQEVNELWKLDINKHNFILLHDTLLEQFNENQGTTQNDFKKSLTKRSMQYFLTLYKIFCRIPCCRSLRHY